MRKTTIKLALAVLLPALALGIILSPMSAMPAIAATVSSAGNASVSSDSYSGSSVALPPFVLTETQPGDIPQGTLTWALPAGFLLDSASVANVSYAGTGLNGSSTVSFVDSTHFSITISSTSTSAGSLTVGSMAPLKVKVSAGAPLAAAGNISLSAGTAGGITATTSFGTLTQVPGAANKLSFALQPQGNAIINSALNSFQVSVQDQFGNTVTGDNGRAVSIAPIIVGSSTLGTLSGSATVSDTAGIAAFSGISYNQTGTIQLRADAFGLTSGYSNNIVFTASGTPPVIPPCPIPTIRLLKNGILVKVAGSSTVYMVVNNTLRPFSTPAIFHAKGKKFRNIVVISQSLFNQLSIGRPVGEGRDDDDSAITLPFICLAPASTSTPPSLSNLPEGSVVKVPGDPTIYIVQNGQLHAIPSLSIFQAWRKNLSEVKEISQTQLQAMAVGQLANYPDGTLIQGSGQTVYVIKEGKKFGIAGMNVLIRNGWSLQNLIRVSEQEKEKIEHGGVED